MAKSDIESGGAVNITGNELYPKMTESTELRWAFIRKVYIILTLQLIVTVGISSVVFFVREISVIITTTTQGLVVFVVSLLLPLLMLWPLIAFEKKHPINLIMLTLFTLSISFAVGLTVYTFWAVKRGHDFSFLGLFLFGALHIILVFSLIQILYPLGNLSSMIFSGIASLLFCGYIVYDTNQLIKKLNYDEYTRAAISLYLDVINLFMHLLGIGVHTQ